MKFRSLLFSICLWLCTTMTGWGQKVVDVPWYDSTNTYSFDITRIEITKEATIVTGQVKYFPGEWICVVSRTVLKGESGKEYKLLKGEGIELNQRVFIPESGLITFRLYFEPLDDGEKKVDYLEGNHEDDWQVRGIYLSEDPTPSVAAGNCVVEGKVIDRPESHRLVLMGYNDDQRIQKPYAIIPVRDGKFRYVRDLKEIKMYWFVFADELAKGAYRPICFFMEPGSIEITSYTYDSDVEPKVRGGEINHLYQKYLQECEDVFHRNALSARYDSLNNLGLYYTPRAMELQGLLSQTARERNRQKADSLCAIYKQLEKDGKMYTSQILVLNKENRRMQKGIQKWKEDYIEKHPSLAMYFVLMDEFRFLVNYRAHELPEEFDMASFKDVERLENLYYTIYKPMYPKHSYTSSIATMLQSLKQIEVGGKYIDFTAPDFDGKPVTLSEQINGKVALIDLWASWCGPCRQSAKSMIPVYEKYKSKGFTIVGIARERDVQSAKNAVLQDGYPWLNLVELNDAGNIWFKYCVGNSGGGTFLVDREGKILAISPTAEEVENVLKEILK